MMTPQEIAKMQLHSIGKSWDTLPARDKNIKDVDLKKVERYINDTNSTGRRIIRETPQEVLEKLGLSEGGKVTWAAILLFGKEPH